MTMPNVATVIARVHAVVDANLELVRWLGVSAVTFALALATLSILSSSTGFILKHWERYVAFLDRRLRLMFVFSSGRNLARTQLAFFAAVIALNIAFDIPYGWFGLLVVAGGPVFYLESERQQRLKLIEEQLEGFLVALANALKTTPSIGAALNSITTVVPNPIRQEIELAVKEIKVGASLDQALIQMASRVGSQQLDSALSSVLIGRQVGGNLPKVLETTASTIREMRRLDGLLRTKTAEGRMQLWVIGALPAVFIGFFSYSWPGYFDPLVNTGTGYMIIGVISLLWVGSLIWARQVLAVNF